MHNLTKTVQMKKALQQAFNEKDDELELWDESPSPLPGKVPLSKDFSIQSDDIKSSLRSPKTTSNKASSLLSKYNFLDKIMENPKTK